MNVTPLIDVLLVLIIIFMIITPLTPQGEDALIPQPARPDQVQRPDEPIRTVVLQVLAVPGEKQPRLKINEDSVSWNELQGRLRAIYQFRKEKVLFVRGDESLDWENVAGAISEAHLAGVDSVALVTPELEQADRSLVAQK